MALTDDEIIIVSVVGTLAGVTIIAIILRLLVPRCQTRKDESALIYDDSQNRQQRTVPSSNPPYRNQQHVPSRDRFHDNIAYASDRTDGFELEPIRTKDYSLGPYPVPVRNGRIPSGNQQERMYSSDIHGDLRRFPNAAELRAVGYGPSSVDRYQVRSVRRTPAQRDDIFHPIAGNISNHLQFDPQHFRPLGRNSLDTPRPLARNSLDIPRPKPPPVSPKPTNRVYMNRYEALNHLPVETGDTLKPFNISSRYRDNWDNQFDPRGSASRSQLSHVGHPSEDRGYSGSMPDFRALY